MNNTLRYHMRIDRTEVLGWGERRAVFWVQGCRHGKCRGCIAGGYRDGSGGTETTCAEMAEWLLNSNPDGLTVSGGEPFEQAAAVAEVVRLVREKKNIDLIVYTGFVYEELLEMASVDAGVQKLLDAAQVIIDGPYDEALDTGQPYIGSANQRVIVLDESCRRKAGDYFAGAGCGRKTELYFSETGTVLVGVPSKEQSEIWHSIERQAGKEKKKGGDI